MKTALDLRNKIEEEHPELKLTEEQAMTLLCQQMEMDKLMNRQKMTNTEFYQDAAQQIIDGLSTIAAITGHPVIAGALEVVNIGGSILRYDYDDAALRSALLVADVIAGGLIDDAKAATKSAAEADDRAMKEIAEADELYLYSKRNGHKLSGDELYQSYLKMAGNSDIPYGYTEEEWEKYLLGIKNVDETQALSKVDPNKILELRAKELEGISANVDEVIEGGSETVHLLDDFGKFIDNTHENNYQSYVKRKISKGQTPKDRIEWKKASDYWTKESPVARGNNFNKTVREADIYDYNEVYLENGKRIDSYDLDAEEIISRKATDLDKISQETYRKYLSEFSQKYSIGTKIRSNAYPELDGLKLEGQYILEIPASNADLPNIKYYEEIASEYNVILRFTEE